MVVPSSTAEYNAYQTSRQSLAIPQSSLLPIAPLNPDGAQYGFHPNMPELQQLFQAQHCAVIANIGPLLEPIATKDQYANRSVALPPQLFSHNDQQDQWHSLKGNMQSRTGWAGRIADQLVSSTAAQQLALNVSLAGQTLFQAGAQAVPYTMGAAGPVAFSGLTGTDALSMARRAAFTTIVNAEYGTVYERGYADVQKRALLYSDRVNTALAAGPTLATVFPTSNLTTQLRTVARLISVSDSLQMSRKIIFVYYDKIFCLII